MPALSLPQQPSKVLAGASQGIGSGVMGHGVVMGLVILECSQSATSVVQRSVGDGSATVDTSRLSMQENEPTNLLHYSRKSVLSRPSTIIYSQLFRSYFFFLSPCRP